MYSKKKHNKNYKARRKFWEKIQANAEKIQKKTNNSKKFRTVKQNQKC